ncbi:MAG: hypothetical protein HXX11_16825 [Desulfuromonadales bacterium]|nr:hypothetical protein [Desulfuromonadales bacterium]
MKSSCAVTGMCVVFSLFLLSIPVVGFAQNEPPKPSAPSVAQQLIREGAFAVKLADILEVTSTDDEIEAESKLGELGIAPRNGWIADYPVTPDIIAELQNSLTSAAEADKLNFEKDEALKRFNRVNQELSLGIRPYYTGEKHPENQADTESPPNPTVINNYYSEQGPPVVTYYTPPADYYYLYSWVPSPFWWFDFWFPGFFILNDFHRVVHFNNRVHFISNHFNDFRRNRVFRIDPAARFQGRTYGGIGVSRSRGVLATGVQHSDRRIFNGGPRTWAPRGGGLRSGAPSVGVRSVRSAPRSGVPSVSRGGRVGSVPRGSGGSATSHGGGSFKGTQRR